MEQIGAYYQCYKRPEALDFVLSNFRKFYDSSSIVLVCDGGLDYTEAAKKYNCTYAYESRVGDRKNWVFSSKKQLKGCAERIGKYIQYVKEKFFIILEDDVYVMNRINYSDLIFDVNGCNFDEDMGNRLKQVLYSYNNNIDLSKKMYYGCCGGSILRTDFFKKITKINIDYDVEEFFEYCDKDKIAADCFLSYLCWKYGGTIGQYKGYCETWYRNYNDRFLKKDIEVLHQYKNLYKED